VSTSAQTSRLLFLVSFCLAIITVDLARLLYRPTPVYACPVGVVGQVIRCTVTPGPQGWNMLVLGIGAEVVALTLVAAVGVRAVPRGNARRNRLPVLAVISLAVVAVTVNGWLAAHQGRPGSYYTCEGVGPPTPQEPCPGGLTRITSPPR
jgi:hypothetical protein